MNEIEDDILDETSSKEVSSNPVGPISK